LTALLVSMELVLSLAGRLRGMGEQLVVMAEELEAVTRGREDHAPTTAEGPEVGGTDRSGLDVFRRAQAVEGEGAGLFEDRITVGLWIAHTAINRSEAGWWSDSIVEVVEQDFHGWVNVSVPAGWAQEVARQALDARSGNGMDITGGALFVLSRQDLVTNGWSAEEAIHAFTEGEHGLFFFRVWPGD